MLIPLPVRPRPSAGGPRELWVNPDKVIAVSEFPNGDVAVRTIDGDLEVVGLTLVQVVSRLVGCDPSELPLPQTPFSPPAETPVPSEPSSPNSNV